MSSDIDVDCMKKCSIQTEYTSTMYVYVYVSGAILYLQYKFYIIHTVNHVDDYAVTVVFNRCSLSHINLTVMHQISVCVFVCSLIKLAACRESARYAL